MLSSNNGLAGKMIIAIDGPAGSGKSTIARLAARALGFGYVDTGAMYRTVTLAALRRGINPENGGKLSRLADKVTIEFRPGKNGLLHIMLDGQDVTAEVRMPDVNANVSVASSHPGVREALVRHQRNLAAGSKTGVVVEGRDVGTVVFPSAGLKIYLDASVEERAKRRQKDMDAAGVAVSVEELVKLLKNRDRLDSTREESPLAKADDAIIIDTTKMTVDEAVGLVTSLVREREGKL